MKKEESLLNGFTDEEKAMIKDDNLQLTDDDKASLQEFLRAVEELNKREPEKLSSEFWDKVWPAIQATGDVPAAYRDRIGVKETTVYDTLDENGNYQQIPQGIRRKGYYDIVWEHWNNELQQVINKYHKIIKKASIYAIKNGDRINENMSLGDFLLSFLSSPFIHEQEHYLLESPFVPMYNSTITNDFLKISKNILQPDLFGSTGTYTTPDGNKILIERFSSLQSGLGTSADKILNTAQMELTQINYHKASNDFINNIVEIPLYEYAEKCGQHITPRIMQTKEEQEKENKRADNALKDFKKQLRKDLAGIESYKESYTVTTGKNKGDFIDGQRLIYKYGISKGNIVIYFDQDAAAMIVRTGGIMQYPTCLLLHDNRNPNAYKIGYKIALHNSMDNNAAAGTNNTLSVKSLLAAAPEIPTYENLQERNARNWKEKIKAILEKNLDEQIRVGLIKKWEYRDPATGKTYTPESAQPLTWPQYFRLMVDFIMVNEPDQTERRQKRAAEKKQAALAAGLPKRKRGRPKKEKQPSLLE